MLTRSSSFIELNYFINDTLISVSSSLALSHFLRVTAALGDEIDEIEHIQIEAAVTLDAVDFSKSLSSSFQVRSGYTGKSLHQILVRICIPLCRSVLKPWHLANMRQEPRIGDGMVLVISRVGVNVVSEDWKR